MNDISKIKVYYNSACPVCDAGINAQKNKSSECAFDWNDIHTNNELVQDVSDDIEYVRERLHVVDENDEVFVGINAFIAIWRHSPKERWKAKLLSLPMIKPFANIAYNIFARLLYQWNRKCSSW